MAGGAGISEARGLGKHQLDQQIEQARSERVLQNEVRGGRIHISEKGAGRTKDERVSCAA